MRILMLSGDPNVLDENSDAGKRMEEYKKVLGEVYILVARGAIFKLISAYFDGAKIIKEKKIEIITAQDIEHSFVAWLLSQRFNIPWQMQIHTDIFSPYFVKHRVFNKIRVMLAKFLIPRAGCIRVVSERIKNSLTWRFHRQVPVAVLSIFVDVEKIKNSSIQTDLHEKYGKDKFIILMASRITKEKNIGMAINAVRQLVSKAGSKISLTPSRTMSELYSATACPHLEILSPAFETIPVLLIVGDGPEKEKLQHMISALGLGENVLFEPRTYDLASYYKTCDLFLLTSNYEGYGMTLLEAAASGAKIISTDVGIAPEVLEQENIIPVGDKNALVEKLKIAFLGKLPSPKSNFLSVQPRTKKEYLELYKRSFEICLKK